MSDPSATLLELTGVSKSFGGVHAVRECSFSIRAGSLTGLIGPNGAGKSTTVDLVSGFKQVDAGTITFAGQQIQNRPPHDISRLGLVRSFQTPREWARLTTLENLLVAAVDDRRESLRVALFGRRELAATDAAGRAEARRVLEEFGLGKVKNELAGNLSGGQKRLLEFARIMMARPKLVFLDEPQSGVNPVLGDRMGEAIQQLVASGITVVMVEHNLAFVERLCDPVIVMALGRPIATGTMAELRKDPAVLDAYLGEAVPHA
ncbi:MAG TPA: ABC transporter ATP-binding protein [Candidatus Limnocylindrales bacterium]|jgi:ABC-type branched-subunit amino acid transport system ATPase component|nr:ABC transporter ATP-binding protein [Candidatus Limnocylindrales bacterium]